MHYIIGFLFYILFENNAEIRFVKLLNDSIMDNKLAHMSIVAIFYNYIISVKQGRN